MSKTHQLLVLEPPVELKFKGPFTEVVTADLKLSNPSKKRICFKVKTTAPKQYCVRPNNGLIEPGAVTHVAVMLQPFQYDPNEKNRHKFLVQTLIVPDGITEIQESLWQDTPADQLMESKLKCVFDVDPEMLQTMAQQKSLSATNKMKSDVKGSEDVKSELFHLREENAKLKSEGVRMRRGLSRGDAVATDDRADSSDVMSIFRNPAVIIVILLLIIITLLAGLLIGKFML